jgi:hypothetical protein
MVGFYKSNFIFNCELDCKDKIFFSFFEKMSPIEEGRAASKSPH